MNITALDHLVLTVTDPDRTVAFYTRILGMQAITFGEGRLALRFGEQKINLHVAGREIEPHAAHPVPGSADLCFRIAGPLEAAMKRLHEFDVLILLGPVERTGARGPLRSCYIHDPDGNLIELATETTSP